MKSRWLGSSLLVGAALVSGGCYHAIVDTGRQPSGTVVENKWATSFVDGLVPPHVVETAQKCPNGVAKVETQMSFMNALVRVITWGIYSPMTITVQCAAASGDDAPAERTVRVPASASGVQLDAAVQQAAGISARTGEPAYVVLSN